MTLDIAVAFELDDDSIRIATACCGGGTTLPAGDHGGIADYVADHIRMCLPDLLDEEFPTDSEGNDD